SARRGPMGARPDVDALTPVKFPKCFWAFPKRSPGSIRQLIMDRGMLWSFDGARTFRAMVSNGIDKRRWRPCSKHLRVGLLSVATAVRNSRGPCVSRLRRSGLPAEAHPRGGRPQARRRCLAAGWCANGHSSKPTPCNIGHHRQLSTLDRRQRRPCFLMHAV
ncbi:MAG: hypothetical protein QOJ15_9459, partial [Bradyrhizobium sp.]|nr:hypothetical protein [Bradyrhizobium sp.]